MNLILTVPDAPTVEARLKDPQVVTVKYCWKTLRVELDSYRKEESDCPRDLRNRSKEQTLENIIDTKQEDIEIMYYSRNHYVFGSPEDTDDMYIFKRKDGIYIYLNAHVPCSCGKKSETLAFSENFAKFWDKCLTDATRRLFWDALNGKHEGNVYITR
jgi:hypothetical protein